MENNSTIASKILLIEVPEELREIPAWLIWRFERGEGEAKPRKVPYWADGMRRYGANGDRNDRERLTTFPVARAAAAEKGFEGVGFAPLPGCGYTFLDFDNCVAPDGSLPQEIELIAARTYVEYSPSGNGIRVALKGDFGNRKSATTPDQYGFETFSTSGYVTFTGAILDFCDLMVGSNHIAEVDDRVRNLCEKRFGSAQPQAEVDPDDFMLGHEPRLGLSVERMEEHVDELDPDMGRADWIKVGMALHHECEGDDTGFEIWDVWSSDGATYPGTEGLRVQWDSFERSSGQRRKQVTFATVLWMVKDPKYRRDKSGSLKTSLPPNNYVDWPEPLPLQSGLLPVPQLQENMLPEGLGHWLGDIADRMCVPLDFTASAGVLMLGSLLGSKIGVRPQEHTNWVEPANLWGCIIAPPGALKSPAIREVFGPIKQLEHEAQEANKQKLKQHERDLIVYKAKQEAAQKKAREAGDPLVLLSALTAIGDAPPKPPLKRFMTSNVTVEKLGEICVDNPNGILYHRDELISLMCELDRKEKVTDRGFLMSGWSGQDPYTFDRIGRGTTYVPSVTLSLFGTSQPNRMSGYISASLASFDDGMVQRLQILVWPDLPPTWVSMDCPSDERARECAFQLCRRLAELRPEDVGAEISERTAIPFLRLSEDAREMFVAYRNGLEAMVRGNCLHPALTSHLAKYRGLVPRIALIMHLAAGGTGPVSSDAMGLAIRWANYLEAHARRVYAAAETAPIDTAKLVWKLIEDEKLSDGFTARDIYARNLSKLGKREDVENALAKLVAAGWLVAREQLTGGRPSVRHFINPKAKTISS